MNSGFTQAQFDMLRDFGGASTNGPHTDQAYSVLKQAHYATRGWAENIKMALFPKGKVKAQRALINQGGNYTPYT
jgi:hypothetical protein